MSQHIPFDIQTEILKRLPAVKPLVRFQSVSKQWKSFVKSYEFINDHTRINHNRSQSHLLVCHTLDSDQQPQFTSIIDDDTFPNRKVSLTSFRSLTDLSWEMLDSVNGLSCSYGFHSELRKRMAVLWNPIIRKSVGIVIPCALDIEFVVGFGFCSDTSDPKLVKVNTHYMEKDVMVFTLSSRVWKSVRNVPAALNQCGMEGNQVCVKGCIYWTAVDLGSDDWTKLIVSFDLESEKFGLVRRLPECFLQIRFWKVAEVNESLCVLADDDYDDRGNYDNEVRGCGVWMMDIVTKSFTKMFTIKQPSGKWPLSGVYGVLGFRKNGEVIIDVLEEDGIEGYSRLEVYEPSSGCINGIGINGKSFRQRVSLYMETLLLLDETSSIIH